MECPNCGKDIDVRRAGKNTIVMCYGCTWDFLWNGEAFESASGQG